MKRDYLVPIILVLCLIALAYILTEIFRSPSDAATAPAEITLDPSRYQDPPSYEEEASSGTNISNTPEALDSSGQDPLDSYYREPEAPPASPSYGGQSNSAVRPTEPSTPTNDQTAGSENLPPPTSTPVGGRYLVIAGSFRQLAGAETRVRALKKEGFNEAEVGKTNRGAFAVAVVGSTDSRSSAESLAAQVRQKGYEVLVKARE